MNHGGRLTVESLQQAVERAEQRVRARRPGDEERALQWLRVFRARLERAKVQGRA